MPQMAPLLWTPLFFIFIIMLIFVMAKILFTNTSNFNSPTGMKTKSQDFKISWKW